MQHRCYDTKYDDDMEITKLKQNSQYNKQTEGRLRGYTLTSRSVVFQ